MNVVESYRLRNFLLLMYVYFIPITKCMASFEWIPIPITCIHTKYDDSHFNQAVKRNIFSYRIWSQTFTGMCELALVLTSIAWMIHKIQRKYFLFHPIPPTEIDNILFSMETMKAFYTKPDDGIRHDEASNEHFIKVHN